MNDQCAWVHFILPSSACMFLRKINCDPISQLCFYLKDMIFSHQSIPRIHKLCFWWIYIFPYTEIRLFWLITYFKWIKRKWKYVSLHYTIYYYIVCDEVDIKRYFELCFVLIKNNLNRITRVHKQISQNQ